MRACMVEAMRKQPPAPHATKNEDPAQLALLNSKVVMAVARQLQCMGAYLVKAARKVNACTRHNKQKQNPPSHTADAVLQIVFAVAVATWPRQ